MKVRQLKNYYPNDKAKVSVAEAEAEMEVEVEAELFYYYFAIHFADSQTSLSPRANNNYQISIKQ